MYKEIVIWFLGWAWIRQSDAEMRVQLYKLRKGEQDIGSGHTVTPVSARSLEECAVRCAGESVCSGFHSDQSAVSPCQLLSVVDYQIPYGEWYLSQSNPWWYALGGPVQSLSYDAGRHLNIFLDLSFRSRGLVRKWRYFAKRGGEFVASVWRPVGNNGYQLVARDYVVAGASGLGEQYTAVEFLGHEGDVLGIHYKRPDSGYGVVPYVSTHPGSSLCCNQQLSDLSRVMTAIFLDENLQIGSVLNKTLESYRRIPALVAEIVPIPD